MLAVQPGSSASPRNDLVLTLVRWICKRFDKVLNAFGMSGPSLLHWLFGFEVDESQSSAMPDSGNGVSFLV